MATEAEIKEAEALHYELKEAIDQLRALEARWQALPQGLRDLVAYKLTRLRYHDVECARRPYDACTCEKPAWPAF